MIELYKINEVTIAVNERETIVKELTKESNYNEVIKEKWVTTAKDFRQEELLIYGPNGIFRRN